MGDLHIENWNCDTEEIRALVRNEVADALIDAGCELLTTLQVEVDDNADYEYDDLGDNFEEHPYAWVGEYIVDTAKRIGHAGRDLFLGKL